MMLFTGLCIGVVLGYGLCLYHKRKLRSGMTLEQVIDAYRNQEAQHAQSLEKEG